MTDCLHLNYIISSLYGVSYLTMPAKKKPVSAKKKAKENEAWCCGAGDNLCSVLINDGLAYFMDTHWHRVTGNPVVPFYAAVTVAGCQMPHGTGKCQSWINGLPPSVILFGYAECDPRNDNRTVPWASSCSGWKLLVLLLSALSPMCRTCRAATFWISRAWHSIFFFYRVAVLFCSNNYW